MGRGYSYSPSPPPRSYRRRASSPIPRDRYGGRSRDLPTSLLVRNLRRDCRPEDLRRPFGQFGRLKDIYIPRDYYSGEPRGFGFVQYYDPDDAADAKYYMDGQVILGREVAVVFTEENRKKHSEMRSRDRISGSRGRSYDQRYSRSPRYSPPPRARSPYRRSPSYSRSPSPRYARRRMRERSYSPVESRSRSRSPVEERYGGSTRRERSLSVSGYESNIFNLQLVVAMALRTICVHYILSCWSSINNLGKYFVPMPSLEDYRKTNMTCQLQGG